jgi:putative sugar O-methyltransferase
VIKDRAILPYGLQTSDIRETAYRHCELVAQLTDSAPISSIEASTFGNPQDVFEVGGRMYTMPFLSTYLRYCSAQKHISFKGDETVIELGSGSGYQIEILKKLYPNLTILCFDLPAQIYLCEEYLARALGPSRMIGTDETLKWEDLSGVKKGHVHFLGNWKFPLLRDFQFDVFWNAASFGEMEPDIVENYLGYVKGNARWIYLLQARHGKDTVGRAHVKKPISLADYKRFLTGYRLCEEHDAWRAHRRLRGYFEALWMKD